MQLDNERPLTGFGELSGNGRFGHKADSDRMSAMSRKQALARCLAPVRQAIIYRECEAGLSDLLRQQKSIQLIDRNGRPT